MTTDSFTFGEVQRVVQQAVTSGAISELQRWSWENRIAKNPGAVKQLHLERPVDRPEPQQVPYDPNGLAPMGKSHGAQFGEWLAEQKDFGQGNGEPVPPKPSLRSPTTTASGIPIADVLRLPQEVRQSVAREADRATAQALIETYLGVDGDVMVEIACQPGHEAYEDMLDYSMELEAWRNDPRVPLSEVERDLALSRPSQADDGTAFSTRSNDPADSPEAAYARIEALHQEIEQLNPSYQPPWRTSIDIHDGHR